MEAYKKFKGTIEFAMDVIWRAKLKTEQGLP